MENADPTRENARTLSELPKDTTSKTDNFDPNLTKLRNDIDDPMWK
jgi:hypothetical protein